MLTRIIHIYKTRIKFLSDHDLISFIQKSEGGGVG